MICDRVSVAPFNQKSVKSIGSVARPARNIHSRSERHWPMIPRPPTISTQSVLNIIAEYVSRTWPVYGFVRAGSVPKCTARPWSCLPGAAVQSGTPVDSATGLQSTGAEVRRRRRRTAAPPATEYRRRPDRGTLSRFGRGGEADAPDAGAGGRVANGDPAMGGPVRAGLRARHT